MAAVVPVGLVVADDIGRPPRSLERGGGWLGWEGGGGGGGGNSSVARWMDVFEFSYGSLVAG